MSRSKRQSKILEIISSKEIETQDELVSELSKCGFNVTQATISRDIKELGLIKATSDQGVSRIRDRQIGGLHNFKQADNSFQRGGRVLYHREKSGYSQNSVGLFHQCRYGYRAIQVSGNDWLRFGLRHHSYGSYDRRGRGNPQNET